MTQNNGQFTPGFGSAKFGSDFFPDAKPNPDQLVSRLMSGNSAAVFGLRGIGKSSLLAETRERLRAQGRQVIWVDVEKHDTLSKVFAVIVHSMRRENKKGLFSRLRYWLDNSKIVPRVFKTKAGALATLADDRLPKDYNEKYIEVVSRQAIWLLEDQGLDPKPIIIFDEFPTLIKRAIDDSKAEEMRLVVGRLNSVLGLLRSLRGYPAGVPMAVSGSISLDWFVEEYGIRRYSINNCFNIDVEELDRQGAKKLLEMCLNAVSLPNWSEQFTEDLLDFLPSYYPGVIQLAFEVIGAVSTPVATLDDSMRDSINMALSKYYYEQLDDFFKQFSTSEQDRINNLFDVLITKENGKMRGWEALDILNGVELDKDELDGDSIIDRLVSRSFIDILGDKIRFSSRLVSGWHNFRKKKVND